MSRPTPYLHSMVRRGSCWVHPSELSEDEQGSVELVIPRKPNARTWSFYLANVMRLEGTEANLEVTSASLIRVGPRRFAWEEMNGFKPGLFFRYSLGQRALRYGGALMNSDLEFPLVSLEPEDADEYEAWFRSTGRMLVGLPTWGYKIP